MNKSKKINLDECNIVALRVRGMTGVRYTISGTLERLRLTKKNMAVLLKDTPDIQGMLKKSKDFITWGIIDDETKKALIEKRGQKDTEGNMKSTFNLNSPTGGFERKGIKKPFNIGGALGNREDKINNLINRML